MTKFSIKLKELRQEYNLTQKDVAQNLGISATCYAGYEQGYREPNFEILHNLCTMFNVTADELLGFENDEKCKIQNNIKDNHGNINFNQR